MEFYNTEALFANNTFTKGTSEKYFKKKKGDPIEGVRCKNGKSKV